MELFLVRHAIALDAYPGQDDSDRALSPVGRRKFSESVRGIRRLGVSLPSVLHSPWRRAAQTAALLGPVVTGALEAEPALVGPPGKALLARLARFPEESILALVGHEPWLSALVALLVCGEARAASSFAFEKGGWTQLEGRPVLGGMRVRSVLPPRVLHHLH